MFLLHTLNAFTKMPICKKKNVKYSKIFWSEFSILEYYLLVNPPPLLPIIFSDKFS